MEEVYNDLTICPPGKCAEDKFYIGFYDQNVLVAVMDLIAGYPDDSTAFLGFFMMNPDYQGKGIGTSLISECCDYLKSIGFSAVQLGFDKGNPQAKHFWHKNQFVDIKECPQEDGIIVLAGRNL